MVLREENPSFRAASCCTVEVVNGGDGVRLTSRSRTSRTRYDASRSRSTCCCASASADRIRPRLSGDAASLSSPICTSRAGNADSSPFGARRASTVQYSFGSNARISRSRSTISRSATDCTRPADSPVRTFFHRIGEIR